MNEGSLERPAEWPRRFAAWLLELVNGLAGRKSSFRASGAA